MMILFRGERTTDVEGSQSSYVLASQLLATARLARKHSRDWAERAASGWSAIPPILRQAHGSTRPSR